MPGGFNGSANVRSSRCFARLAYCARRYLLMWVLTLVASQGLADASVQPSAEGKVRFYNLADADFDVYSKNPSAAMQEWMRAHYYRMQTYTPYFDSRLSWYPDAWFYKDAYAIYRGSSLFEEHPDWVMRDADGSPLYIPWGCSDGVCPQYAADFGNQAFRDHWIEDARESLKRGYRGIWIDDVNMTWRVGDGSGRQVVPLDARSGAPMTLQDWRRYLAEFMEQIRSAFPDAEIAHNAIWFAGDLDDPHIRRQTGAADYFNFERGASDSGLTGGTGRYGFETFLEFIDEVHAVGTGAILMDKGSTPRALEYGLAAWFLISNGTDMMSSTKIEFSAPDSWWPGFELDLGHAEGPRYSWAGVLRRDFSCGSVLLNQPDAGEVTLSLPEAYRTVEGNSVTQVTLAERSAKILMKECLLGNIPRPPTLDP